MHSSAPASNNLRRSLRALLHYQRCGTVMAARLRLVDPVLLEVLGDALLFRGCVNMSREHGMWEYEQLWLVRPRLDLDGPPLQPFDVRPYFSRVPETPARQHLTASP